MGMGITNLWAQSGMKARDTALLGILLALYDFIATVQLPLMGELVARLSDLHDRLRRAIDVLPPKFRRVVHLRCWRDLSFAEIGRLLKMPETTAKTYFLLCTPSARCCTCDADDGPARRSTRRNRLGEGVSRSCSRRGPSSTPW